MQLTKLSRATATFTGGKQKDLSSKTTWALSLWTFVFMLYSGVRVNVK